MFYLIFATRFAVDLDTVHIIIRNANSSTVQVDIVILSEQCDSVNSAPLTPLTKMNLKTPLEPKFSNLWRPPGARKRLILHFHECKSPLSIFKYSR